MSFLGRVCSVSTAVLLWPTFLLSSAAAGTVATAPTFYSRPDLMPPQINITTNTGGAVPGYIFTAQYDFSTGQTGPYIFDGDGNLVWSGYGIGGTANTHDFRPVTINGQTRLIFYSGTTVNGYGRGHGGILDTSYIGVQTVVPGNGRTSMDMHEINVVENGKNAIISIFQPTPYDLSAYGVSGIGWVASGVFQEIDLQTGDVLFDWSSLDHVPLSATHFTTHGEGGAANNPWDYFHINAIDKDNNGNYWVSSRYTDCLYNIDGKTGDIIYRVGGVNSSFSIDDNAHFSSQHNVRFINSTESAVVLTLFDNASDGSNITAPYSRGMMISLNTDKMTVSLLAEYISPSKLRSDSQGNVQLLDNGNVFVGWGSQTYYSEFTQDGTCIFDANWADMKGMNYRAFKANFTATPVDVPAVFALKSSNAGNSNTTVYVSWNGATDVTSWNVYGSSNGSYTLAGSAKKTGFETNVTLTGDYSSVVVEALDLHGKCLGSSSATSPYTM